MPHALRISVVIPACNESKSLPLVLNAIPRELVQRIVVADNGSSDDTAAVARAHGADVVLEARRGYGWACWSGVQSALNVNAIDRPDVLVMFDAAHKEDPSEMPLLLAPLLADTADFVLGSRIQRAAPGALRPAQRFGNWLTTQVMRSLYAVSITDLAPFRAIRVPLFERLDMRERTFGWPTEMIVKAALCGARISEVDVRYQPRYSGKSKVSGTVSGSIKAGVVILRTAIRYRTWRPEHA